MSDPGLHGGGPWGPRSFWSPANPEQYVWLVERDCRDTLPPPPDRQIGFGIPLLCRTCVTLGRGPGAVRDDKA